MWPNQQCQSTEGGWSGIRSSLNPTRPTPPCYNNTTCMQWNTREHKNTYASKHSEVNPVRQRQIGQTAGVRNMYVPVHCADVTNMSAHYDLCPTINITVWDRTVPAKKTTSLYQFVMSHLSPLWGNSSKLLTEVDGHLLSTNAHLETTVYRL